MSDLLEELYAEHSDNRRKKLAGKDVAIPFPFERFGTMVPGIRQRQYYITTASAKVGKSKFTDFLFMYHPLKWYRERSTNIIPRIFYFSLEMSQKDKIREAIAYRVYDQFGEILSPEMQMSVYNNQVLSSHQEKLIDKVKPWIRWLLERVTFIDSIRSAREIYLYMMKYACDNGRHVGISGKEYNMGDLLSGSASMKADHIRYFPDRPDEYVMIICDHIGLLSHPKGSSVFNAIQEYSSKYCIRMRDRWGYIPISVQQQMSAKENLDHARHGHLGPSTAGLADNKSTQRDCNMMLGLYAPARYGYTEHNGYDLTRIGKYYRELSILLTRNGPPVSTDLFFNPASNYFAQMPTPNDTQGLAEVIKSVNYIEANQRF